MRNNDKNFANSIPQIYEKYLVPLIFEPYAQDLLSRLHQYTPSRVLEIASGTGVVTRLLASELPESVAIVATDLNQAMLDEAIKKGTQRPVEWQQADVINLPFEDDSFDTVVCQFGAMFFSDKVKAYAEIYRVLKPNGVFIFNVWGTVKENDYATITTKTLESIFPNDPPKFLTRAPYSYNDEKEITDHLKKAGFKKKIQVETITKWSHATSPRIPAIAYIQGVPIRDEIESRGMSLKEATDAVEKAMTKKFGEGPVKAKIQAIVVSVEK